MQLGRPKRSDVVSGFVTGLFSVPARLLVFAALEQAVADGEAWLAERDRA